VKLSEKVGGKSYNKLKKGVNPYNKYISKQNETNSIAHSLGLTKPRLSLTTLIPGVSKGHKGSYFISTHRWHFALSRSIQCITVIQYKSQ